METKKLKNTVEKVSIILPTFNERENIIPLIQLHDELNISIENPIKDFQNFGNVENF